MTSLVRWREICFASVVVLLLSCPCAVAVDTALIVQGATVARASERRCTNNVEAHCSDSKACYRQCAGGSASGKHCETDEECPNKPAGCAHGAACDVGVCQGPGKCAPYVCLDVTTKKPIVVGSTDLDVVYDPEALIAANVSSEVLSAFLSNIAETGRIRTASVSVSGDKLPAGAVIMRACFVVKMASGCTTVTLEDGDGNLVDTDPGNDFDGPMGSGRKVKYARKAGGVCVKGARH